MEPTTLVTVRLMMVYLQRTPVAQVLLFCVTQIVSQQRQQQRVRPQLQYRAGIGFTNLQVLVL
jgi:hypothetical protein